MRLSQIKQKKNKTPENQHLRSSKRHQNVKPPKYSMRKATITERLLDDVMCGVEESLPDNCINRNTSLPRMPRCFFTG